MCVCACVLCFSLITPHLLCFKAVSHWTWNSLPRLLTNELQGSVCFFLISATAGVTYMCMWPHLTFYIGHGHPNLDSHAFMANPLWMSHISSQVVWVLLSQFACVWATGSLSFGLSFCLHRKQRWANSLSFLLGSLSLITQLEAGPEIHQQEDFDWEDTPRPTNWTFSFPSCVIGISSIRS